jgi:hypothetical protein
MTSGFCVLEESSAQTEMAVSSVNSFVVKRNRDAIGIAQGSSGKATAHIP